MTQKLPKLPSLEFIENRLPEIFPEGTQNRAWHTNNTAAKTIFVMMYVGAVEGNNYWLRPDQVTRMTDKQSQLLSDSDRLDWIKFSTKQIPKDKPIIGRWYDINSREQVRDDCIKNALIVSGTVVVKDNVPTSSSAGRYALESEFVELLNPDLKGKDLEKAITEWSEKHLSKAAIVRQQILKQTASTKGHSLITVQLPNGDTRKLTFGPSSEIAKAVCEDFAPRFLSHPVVIWISEGANKEDVRDKALADMIGINIEADKHLPDMILADLEGHKTLIVFVEVVASDGPINESRKKALLKIIEDAKLPTEDVAFVTAYKDRENNAFKKTFSVLAWQSFAWCMSEPDKIIALRDVSNTQSKLQDLMAKGND
ncbi:BsuBI/PstI family type II restriction endonuclease [uncultured Methylophaga sp.]|uniref:BsuBI/PstI family type II restriction endonuclease n=1 Tax=uncultured Methylophaga sp. TaxID=285271 RepID=UPI0026388BB5|nr:BsuBI/PstI family type II restriction endonuclease [uncultured Methylophaga sp.]